MKKTAKKIISFVLCISLCINYAISAYAANETNQKGVEFIAELDKNTISVSDEDQTVVMRVNASKEISLDGIGGTIVWDEALELTSITNEDDRINFTAGNINMNNGKIAWNEESLEMLDEVTNIAVATFTIPANTPAGTYTLGMKDIELTENMGDIWESSATATATLTITEGYMAEITTLSQRVNVGDQITVNVGVSHGEEDTFAAAEVTISYDSDYMTFDQEKSGLGAATIRNRNNKITIEDYGADKNFDTGVYTIVFDAIADGEATVCLESAAFINKKNAVKSDLKLATISSSTIDFVIDKRTYAVTLPEIFEGSSNAVEGEDYTFTAKDYNNYDYDSISATMNNNPVDVINNGNGTYTIKNVTGIIEITGNRTEKTYSVTFNGNAAEDIKDGAPTATYNTDYTFTLPKEKGWAYSVDEIKIGDNIYRGYQVEDSVYTILGSAITGDIVITVSKSSTEVSVTVVGTGAGIAAGYEVVANMNEKYVLSTAPELGYTYTVTATMGESLVEVIDNGDNSYTIENVTGSIIFTIERKVVVTGVGVKQYLSLDGSIMWLVQNEVTLETNKVPTYDGNSMYWSEKYNAYCYLVVSELLSVEDAASKVDITDGETTNIVYDNDVNKTGVVDAADAQLIYNMYNAEYSEFNADVTIEKFLCADTNGDAIINVEDAVVVINDILK